MQYLLLRTMLCSLLKKKNLYFSRGSPNVPYQDKKRHLLHDNRVFLLVLQRSFRRSIIYKVDSGCRYQCGCWFVRDFGWYLLRQEHRNCDQRDDISITLFWFLYNFSDFVLRLFRQSPSSDVLFGNILLFHDLPFIVWGGDIGFLDILNTPSEIATCFPYHQDRIAIQHHNLQLWRYVQGCHQ